MLATVHQCDSMGTSSMSLQSAPTRHERSHMIELAGLANNPPPNDWGYLSLMLFIVIAMLMVWLYG